MHRFLHTISAARLTFISIGILALHSCKEPCKELTEFHIYATEIGWEEKGDCSIKLSYCEQSDSSAAEIKFRGGMSSKYDKHSYTVEFADKKSIDGLDESKHWVLTSSYIDKTFMRHKLCFDLFRQMNSNNIAPHCSYVKVFENEHYNGLYILMERMDKNRLHLVKGDKKAFIFKEPPLFYPVNPAENRDSLYLESQEYPKSKKGAANGPLLELEKLIFEGSDENFKKQIFQYLDMDNIIDWQLLLMFTNNGDGQLKNYYIYRQDSESPMRIALWDYDHGLGRDGDNERNMLERMLDEKRNTLMKRLIELNPERFNEKMAQRWKELRKSTITVQNIDKMIAENNEVIEPYIKENAKLWPVDGKWYFDKNDYYQEIKLIQTYVKKRLIQMDQRFGN